MINNSITIILLLLAFTNVNAQLIKEQSVDASIGLGYTFPYDDVDTYGSGFYLQGEYVLTFSKWIDVRPYAGIIITKTNTEDKKLNEPGYKSETKAFLIGGKIRLTAPIPWVAPYVEIGVGASIGAFETVTPYTNIDKSGVVLQIPWTIGLELGRKHNFDLAITYYMTPDAEQFVGALAFGMSFPLDKD